MATLGDKLHATYRVLEFLVNRKLRYNAHESWRVPSNPKFMSPEDAASLVKDGSVVATSGLAASMAATQLNLAIKNVFVKTGHPRGLTLVTAGGTGTKGKVPGTPDDLAQKGLVDRLFVGHFDTFEGFKKLVRAGELEAHILPQGVICMLIDRMAKEGVAQWEGPTGRGTFLDVARGGRGTVLCSNTRLPAAKQHVLATSEGNLRYWLPAIDTAIINAPKADRKGNIYFDGASQLCESLDICLAAKRSNGTVLVQVGCLVSENHGGLMLDSKYVDAIVLASNTEQSATFYHAKPYAPFLPTDKLPTNEAVIRAYDGLRFIMRLFNYRVRTTSDERMARLALQLLTRTLPKDALVNIGTGLPEMICVPALTSGLLSSWTFVVESGVWGGLPCLGAYFGCSLFPKRIISSGETFKKLYYSKRGLDCTVLGAYEVDEEGNVNVSSSDRGPGEYIGPGGFIDLAQCAKMVVFVTSFQHKQSITTANSKGTRLRITKKGTPKFVKRVSEITFNASMALKDGKIVYYVTPIGLFRLTPEGLQLEELMPGITTRDVEEGAEARILISKNLREVAPEVVTGVSAMPKPNGAQKRITSKL
mmetsp:Transcript_23552/g.45916  ORF Transcript_23552/g.45916 Transcript_23552/m.45916 type:complete len:591 (-) Transcript_23552:407-2179(-)